MKTIFITLCLCLFSLFAFAQKGANLKTGIINDTLLYVISKRPVSPAFQSAVKGIMRLNTKNPSFEIRDSLLWFTREFEKSVLAGEAKGVFDEDVVRMAQKKYPGKSVEAVLNRNKMYLNKK